MKIDETPLPGIGVRREFRLSNGRRMGVLTHRDGHTELILSRVDDPDACAASIPLNADESLALGTLLGSAQLITQLAEEQKNVVGVTTHQILIRPGSFYDGRLLSDTQMRTRTGTSIVAILRGKEVIASPRPDQLLQGGDMVVVVGTDAGLAQAGTLLQAPA